MKLPFDFSIKLIFRLVFPGFILAAALVPGLQALLHVSGLPIKFEYLFAIEVIALGWLVVVNDMTIYMIFEGRRYWPSFIRNLLISCEKRLNRLRNIVINRPLNLDDLTRSEAALEYSRYPITEGGVADVEYPTRLGNLIESYERYPDVKYGLDAVFYWPRLWLVLDKDLREEIDSAQAVVDSTVYIPFALYVSGIVMLVYAVLRWLSVELPHVPASNIILSIMALGCLFVGFVIYRSSLHGHYQFGELFKSVFDEYRSKLVFDDVLDDVARITGDPTLTLKLSQSDKNRIIWLYLRWHRIRDKSIRRSLTVKEWRYRKAADQGDARAQYNMGMMFANGDGARQNYVTAVEWYRKAAEQGLADARFSLADMYFRGRGVPRDDVMAYMWFDLAASQGKENAGNNRDRVARRMTPEQITEAQNLVAGYWFMRALSRFTREQP